MGVLSRYFAVSQTPAGVFAGNKKIPAGTFVGVYAGELLTNSVAEQRGMYAPCVLGRTYPNECAQGL